jgi:iron complex transport system ATP-binding protein
MTTNLPSAVKATNITAGYGEVTILDGVDLDVPRGAITTLIGPNGCGKSTLMKVCTKLLAKTGGTVEVGDVDISKLSVRELALQMAVLPQSPVAPENLTVRDLVEQGCYARVGPFGMLRRQHHDAINAAIAQVELTRYMHKDVDSLSGGERQRAWIALTLAQQTDLLVLDEPTTYLDVGHQLEVLELIRDLNKTKGMTVVMVLHDLNQAAQFSDYLVVLKRGRIVTAGAPWDVVTPEMLHDVFGIEATVIEDPRHGTPFIIAHRSVPRENKA